MKCQIRSMTFKVALLFAGLLPLSMAFAAGGETGGGGNLMPNGQTVDQYLFEHRLSDSQLEQLKKIAAIDLDEIRQRVPGFAQRLENAFALRHWYNVDVTLAELPHSVTMIPFDSTQGAVQDADKVILSRLYTGSDTQKLKYAADLIIHELVKIVVWSERGHDDPNAVFGIVGPIVTVPMSSGDQIVAALRSTGIRSLRYMSDTKLQDLGRFVDLNRKLHDDVMSLLPEAFSACSRAGADMTQDGFNAALQGSRNQLSRNTQMVHFRSPAEMVSMASQFSQIFRQSLEDRHALYLTWDKLRPYLWCQREEKFNQFNNVYVSKGYPTEFGSMSAKQMNVPVCSFEFLSADSNPFDDLRLDWATQFDDRGDNGICAFVYYWSNN